MRRYIIYFFPQIIDILLTRICFCHFLHLILSTKSLQLFSVYLSISKGANNNLGIIKQRSVSPRNACYGANLIISRIEPRTFEYRLAGVRFTYVHRGQITGRYRRIALTCMKKERAWLCATEEGSQAHNIPTVRG